MNGMVLTNCDKNFWFTEEEICVKITIEYMFDLQKGLGAEMDRCILHCDLNNFYASVECRDNPRLAAYPVAVCGSVEERRGIVLAKNEKAKKFGVRTAETVWSAQQKCPDLVIVPPRHERYRYFSKLMQEIYLSYTDQVEPFGIDECWLDVTGSVRLFGAPEVIAEQIRAASKRELGLTVSVGVSFNKVFAKLASDLKKPDAVTVVNRQNFKEKIWPLPAGYLIGVGPSSAKRLQKSGIHTIGELAAADPKSLEALLGKSGREFWEYANGIGHDSVSRLDMGEAPKSIGNSVTCTHDLHTEEEAARVLLFLAEKVSGRLRRAGYLAAGLQLSIKDNQLHVEQHQCRIENPTRLSSELAAWAKRLFREGYRWRRPIRMLGIACIALISEREAGQTSLFYDIEREERLEGLEERVDILRQKYGKNMLVRASLMEDIAVAKQKNSGNEEKDPHDPE